MLCWVCLQRTHTTLSQSLLISSHFGTCNCPFWLWTEVCICARAWTALTRKARARSAAVPFIQIVRVFGFSLVKNVAVAQRCFTLANTNRKLWKASLSAHAAVLAYNIHRLQAAVHMFVLQSLLNIASSHAGACLNHAYMHPGADSHTSCTLASSKP